MNCLSSIDKFYGAVRTIQKGWKGLQDEFPEKPRIGLCAGLFAGSSMRVWASGPGRWTLAGGQRGSFADSNASADSQPLGLAHGERRAFTCFFANLPAVADGVTHFPAVANGIAHNGA